MVFHTNTEIINKGIGKTRSIKENYNNVLVIKDDNFNDFLDIIDDEEIEKIKFKLKRKKTKGVKRYYSYKIKLDKKSKELKGQLIENKTSVEIIPFDTPYTIVPKTSKTKTKTTITNYVDKDDLSEYDTPFSINQFVNETSLNISNILNKFNNKYSNYAKSPVISKILDFLKIQNMLGDGSCGY
jgi:hypothetical protein